jgi:hypothetical protein
VADTVIENDTSRERGADEPVDVIHYSTAGTAGVRA